MQRGLVRRYFTMCCSIILTSIILLGVIFMVFAAQYFKEDKLGALEKNAKYAAEMTEQMCIRDSDTAAQLSSMAPEGIGVDGKFDLFFPALQLQCEDVYKRQPLR